MGNDDNDIRDDEDNDDGEDDSDGQTWNKTGERHWLQHQKRENDMICKMKCC